MIVYLYALNVLFIEYKFLYEFIGPMNGRWILFLFVSVLRLLLQAICLRDSYPLVTMSQCFYICNAVLHCALYT